MVRSKKSAKNICVYRKKDNFATDLRKDAGVAERGGLENRCTGNRTQGSNPCLSAKSQSEDF